MKNNNDTPDTMEVDVGCEKTPYQNRSWTLRCGKDNEECKWIGWVDEVRVLSNQRGMIRRARRSFLYKGRVLRPNR